MLAYSQILSWNINQRGTKYSSIKGSEERGHSEIYLELIFIEYML
jgi:hypothetical protein